MSEDSAIEVGAENWLGRFVDIAKRMQMATPDPNRPRAARTELPEHKRKATEELRAILLPLRAHLTQAQIEQLLYDDDPDVRLAAATTLGAKNEELRLSAIASVWFSLSMDEVLANRKRARSKTATSSSLADMGADELLAAWLDACERKALADRYLDWGAKASDRRTCDQRLREIVEAQEAIKARGLGEQAAPFMDNKIARARISAALICLTLDEAKALATLESVEKSGGLRERDEARLLLVQLGKKPW
jgi:hypothetical protein